MLVSSIGCFKVPATNDRVINNKKNAQNVFGRIDDKSINKIANRNVFVRLLKSITSFYSNLASIKRDSLNMVA